MFRVREQHHDGVKQTLYDSAMNLKEKTHKHLSQKMKNIQR